MTWETFVIPLITMPILPASMLMLIVLLYWLMVMVGVFDLDVLDFDLDLDGDADSFLSAGFVSLRILNVGAVPLMVWGSVFALSWWVTSGTFWFLRDEKVTEGTALQMFLYVLRNVGIALLATKALTEPMKSFFEVDEGLEPADLVGNECVISTLEATPDSGQARYKTDGAPLLLDVRTGGEKINKGDRAVVLEYDAERKIYLVTRCKDGV